MAKRKPRKTSSRTRRSPGSRGKLAEAPRDHGDVIDTSEDTNAKSLHEVEGYDVPAATAFEDFRMEASQLVEDVRGKPMLSLAGFERARAVVAESSREDDFKTDAWFAEFGTSASRAIVANAEQLEAFMPEVIIGEDDRLRVRETTGYPYRAICSLSITARNGSKWIGTGWLAGPRTVITAGHCVYIHRQGGWARRIDVFPGRDGTDKPYRAQAASLRSVVGWTRDRRPSQDYGAILLDQPVGDQLGFFAYLSAPNDELRNELVNVIGYPGDKHGSEKGTMWWHARKLMALSNSQLFYDIDTYGGNSGGPVVHWDEKNYQVLGIHNYGDLAGNKATRINEDVFENIETWVDE